MLLLEVKQINLGSKIVFLWPRGSSTLGQVLLNRLHILGAQYRPEIFGKAERWFVTEDRCKVKPSRPWPSSFLFLPSKG